MTTSKEKKAKADGAGVTITPPNMKHATFTIEGTSYLCMNAFPEKARQQIETEQEKGQAGKNTKKKKEPKNFDECYKNAMHTSIQGWHGIPAAGLRSAMISACRVAGFTMTRAKLSVFVEQDGFDRNDKMPLVKITKGVPEKQTHPVRLPNGSIDIRARAFFNPGWQADVKVKWDGDQFGLEDMANLLWRVGEQVGVLEGRPDSKQSCGMGWGTFKIINKKERKAA